MSLKQLFIAMITLLLVASAFALPSVSDLATWSQDVFLFIIHSLLKPSL